MPPADITKDLMGDSNGLIASCIWGGIGSGFFIYGWRQQSLRPLWGGIALVAVSYFLENSPLIMSLVSIVIIVAIFWLKRYF